MIFDLENQDPTCQFHRAFIEEGANNTDESLSIEINGKVFEFKPMSPDNWSEEKKALPDYWIENWLNKTTFNSIVAAAKMGKSLLGYELAFHIQNGLTWFGKDVKKGKVLYLDFELSEPDIWQRTCFLHQQFDDEVKKQGNTPTMFDLLPIPSGALSSIGFSDFVDNILKPIITENGYDVIFFDCFYRFHKGDPNSVTDVTNTLSIIKDIQETMKKTVVYITHTNKSGMTNMQEIIYAAGGSGAHGQIVDETYVIFRESAKKHSGCSDYYTLAVGGRSINEELHAKRNAATHHQFVPVDSFDGKLAKDKDCSEIRTKHEKEYDLLVLHPEGITASEWKKNFGYMPTIARIKGLGFWYSGKNGRSDGIKASRVFLSETEAKKNLQEK